MEDGHAKWREIHSQSGWTRCIHHDNQLDQGLKGEIIRYGVFSHAAIMAFEFDSSPKRYRNHLDRLFTQLHGRYGYEKTKLIHAHIDWPSRIGKSLSLMGKLAGNHEKESNLIGYVAVSNDNTSHQIGRRDIVVAWRGSVKPGEWLKDLQIKLKKTGTDEARVAAGFNSIYTFKSDSSKSSASSEVMGEVTRLVQLYKGRGEEVGLTITGHSLGGALALLNAHEAARSHPRLPISVISFGAPRVGNNAFRDELNGMGNVKILRVVNKSDKVTSLPPSNERSTNKMVKISGLEKLFYKHVGKELILYANVRFTPWHAHRPKTYLSLLSGSDSVGFEIDQCECSPRCCVGK